jgi:hypothetical protein
MTTVEWRLVVLAAGFLDPDEREAVLGDLAEASEGWWHGLTGVLGLLVRRQMVLWQNWRPWLAAFGLAFPFSLTLMGISVSIAWTCSHLGASRILVGSAPSATPWLLSLLCQSCLLLACSWAGGVVVGSISRPTLWASAALCLSPGLYCLSKFHSQSLPAFTLFLFLVPAIFGVRQGLSGFNLKRYSALGLAALATVSMLYLWSCGRFWILNWVLLWPAWYLVATARRPDPQAA